MELLVYSGDMISKLALGLMMIWGVCQGVSQANAEGQATATSNFSYAEFTKPFLAKEVKLSEEPVSLIYMPHVNLYFVKAELNGVPCTLLVDTGATHTTFDINFLKKAFPGIEFQATQTVGETNVAEAPQIFSVKELKVGKNVLKDFYGVAISLPQLSSSLEMIKPVGIIGMNTMAAGGFYLSHHDKMLKWIDPVHVKNKVEVPLGVPFDGHVVVPVYNPKNNQGTLALVDSGASYTFLPEQIWPAEDGKLRPMSVTAVNLSADVQQKTGVVGDLMVGTQVTLKGVQPMIMSSREDTPLLGADLMTKFDLLIDAMKGKFYVIPLELKDSEKANVPKN